MFAPIYKVLAANVNVQAVLGSSSPRIYKFGEAAKGATKPYMVYQMIDGAPENYLGQAPDLDLETFQMDIYAETSAEVEAVAKTVVNALVGFAYVSGWRGEFKDPDTSLNVVSFDVDWYSNRN